MVMVLHVLSPADAPRAEPHVAPGVHVAAVLPGEVPESLAVARKLVGQLRYEEAVVELSRYLTLPDRPAKERALALFDLAFIHHVLGDDKNAHERAMEALATVPEGEELELATGSPMRQIEFLKRKATEFQSQVRVQVVPKKEMEAANVVRATLKDPPGRVKQVLLRYAATPAGPFYSARMVCSAGACTGALPAPSSSDLTAYYFVEALDADAATLASAGDVKTPMQMTISGGRSWYKNPWFWGLSGAAVVAVTTVVYLLSPPAPR